MIRWWLAAVAPVLVVLSMGPPAGSAENSGPAQEPAAKGESGPAEKGESDKKSSVIEPAAFAMEEVPAFGKEEVDGKSQYYYPSGSYVMCRPVPNKEVKEYPKLKSKRPLYGAVTFDGGTPGPKAGKIYYFVLDESGEAKPEATEKKTEPSEGKTKPQQKIAGEKKVAAQKKTVQSRMLVRPRVTALTYDRLYFDANGDLDLTNDEMLKPAQKPPFEGLQDTGPSGYFEELKVTFDFGPLVGEKPVALVPHAFPYSADNVLVQFLPKTARKGKIRLGGEEYIARLTQSRTISGRYDRPNVQLELAPTRDSKEARRLSRPLGQMRWIGEQLVVFSATPSGDKLSIEPYRGETGMLEVGAGGRAVTELGIAGQLTSRTGILIAIGETLSQTADAMPRRCTLPVGDYLLPSFTARHGRLRFNGRMTASTAPNAGGASFPIEIRKDKPFVLEFSGKPKVKFASPAKDRSFKPGETIRIAAMLTEPRQNIQITGLWEADKSGASTGPRLDPTIAIRNSAGDVVSEGKMPFG